MSVRDIQHHLDELYGYQLFFAIDGFNGFNEAIEAVYPCVCTLCEKNRGIKMHRSSNKKLT